MNHACLRFLIRILVNTDTSTLRLSRTQRALLAIAIVILFAGAVRAQDVVIDLTKSTPPPNQARVIGPHEGATVWDGEGLHVRLPTTTEGMQQVGIGSEIPLVGDFVVTADFGITKSERPTAGYGKGVSLRVTSAAQPRQRAAIAFYELRNGTRMIVTDVFELGGKQHDRKDFPFEKPGRLRLTREGATIRFAVAEAVSNSFRDLRDLPFSSDNIPNVDLIGDTGGDSLPLEVILKGLTLKSASLPSDKSTSLPIESSPAQPVSSPPTSRPNSGSGYWWIIGLISGAAIGAAGLLYWKRANS